LKMHKRVQQSNNRETSINTTNFITYFAQ